MKTRYNATVLLGISADSDAEAMNLIEHRLGPGDPRTDPFALEVRKCTVVRAETGEDEIATAALLKFPGVLDERDIILGDSADTPLDLRELFDVSISLALGDVEYGKLDPYAQRRIESSMRRKLRAIIAR